MTPSALHRRDESSKAIFCKAVLPFVLPFSLLPAIALADDSSLSIKHANDGLASSDDGHFTSGFELNWMFTPNHKAGPSV